MTLAAALVLAAAASDPRIPLVQLQLADRNQDALMRVEKALAEEPEVSRELGFEYLRGHLLESLDQPRAAADAFADAMGDNSRLEPYSRYRLALSYERFGHPEVAAGLVASVVRSTIPRDLLAAAVELLARTLARGGDCRLLHGFDPSRLPRDEDRYLRVILGDCALRAEEPQRAREYFVGLLREGLHDEPERQAAERLAALAGPAPVVNGGQIRPEDSIPSLLGMALHQHREFERAILYLGQVRPLLGNPLGAEEFDLGFARARSFFWQERFAAAAQEFGWLAQSTEDPERRAQAFFHQARSFELAGRWRQALATFRAAFRAEPDGRWADAALFSMLRLMWLAQEEEEGEKLFEFLASQRSWRGMAARAALFLASTDLVRGRADRAEAWLLQASRVREAETEVEYWQGRLAELRDEPLAAVESYVATLRRDPFHPLAQAARRRLAQPALQGPARTAAGRLAARGRSQDLYDAWLLLGEDSPVGTAALERLRRRLASDRVAAPFVELRMVATEEWPLWQATLRRPEEMLLALGVWSQGAPAVTEHFPLNDNDLTFTASRLLASAGETRHSIRLAEILLQRLPSRVPEPLLPRAFRELLHPLVYLSRLLTASSRFVVDPLLLAAIIREESRFDERALSAASARGLTQFVQPTAERVGNRIGLRNLGAQDIYRPEVSITLGAAYLAQLNLDFQGAAEMVVAAYNAGEPQAALWRRYCLTSEPEEYFTKVGFRETRNYLARVLGSWERYQDLYHGPAQTLPQREAQRTSTTVP